MQIDTELAGAPAPGAIGNDVAQLRRYFAAIKRRWPAILASSLILAFVGFITTPEKKIEDSTERYFRATTTIVISNPTKSPQQVAFIATTGEVSERVADRLGAPIVEVQRSVLASPRNDVLAVDLTGISTSGEVAEQLADTTALELQSFMAAEALETFEADKAATEASIEELEIEFVDLVQVMANAEPDSPEFEIAKNQQITIAARLQGLDQHYAQLTTGPPPSAGISTVQSSIRNQISNSIFLKIREEILSGAAIHLEEDDIFIDQPSSPPSPISRAILGFVVGIGGSIGVILLLDRYDTRIRRREEVEAATGIPVLAEIPPLSRRQQRETDVLTFTRPRSPTAEAFRVIRTAILFSEQSEPETETRKSGRVLMVTSANPSEGKTTTVANLAAVLAESGQSVLVIDCDFRRPRIHTYLEGLGVDPGQQGQEIQGLGEQGRAHLDHTGIPNVKLVTGFAYGEEGSLDEANPAEIVALQQRVIEIARSHFDFVILDTAPFLTTNDAADLIPETDALILVARVGLTKTEAVTRASEFLGRLQAPTLGIILTEADETPVTYYYYGYYLDSQAGDFGDAPNTELGAATPSDRRLKMRTRPILANGNGSQKQESEPPETPPAPPASF